MEHSNSLSASHIKILLEILSSITEHASKLVIETTLQLKFQRTCTHLDISEPPLIHFENESYQSYLGLLQTLLVEKPSVSEEIGAEDKIVVVCKKILQMYLNCAELKSTIHQDLNSDKRALHLIIPLGSAKREELAARTTLVVHSMHVLNNFERNSFRRYVSCLFPLLVNLVRCEHSSSEVQEVLSEIFRSSIGPIVLNP